MTGLTAMNEKQMQMLSIIEKNLQRTLKPVTPNPDFIHRLEDRLTNYPQIVIEKRPQIELILVIVASMIAFMTFFWILWRFVLRKK
jgi:hypothetical protein